VFEHQIAKPFSMPCSARSGSAGRATPSSRYCTHSASSAVVFKRSLGNQNSISGSGWRMALSGASKCGSGVLTIWRSQVSVS
jgi:hypothetical protein